NRFLIVLLAAVSVTASMAGAALLTRPAGLVPAAGLAAAGEARQADMPDPATVLARVEALRERLTADPDDGEGWKLLGRSMIALGRLGEAVAAYSRASQLLPNDPEVRGALLRLEEIARQAG